VLTPLFLKHTLAIAFINTICDKFVPANLHPLDYACAGAAFPSHMNFSTSQANAASASQVPNTAQPGNTLPASNPSGTPSFGGTQFANKPHQLGVCFNALG
jgi:hypothetical protein